MTAFITYHTAKATTEGENPDRHDAAACSGKKLEPAAEQQTVPGSPSP